MNSQASAPPTTSSPVHPHPHDAIASANSVAFQERDSSDRHDQRSATELSSIEPTSQELRYRTLQSPTGAWDSHSPASDERARSSQSARKSHWFNGIKKQWSKHISVTVPTEKRRDHLALERTFLGYLRTSIALSMVGVVIAQLFRLQHSVNPDMELGYYVVSVPLGATFLSASIFVVLVGAYRFWRQQNAMLRGKAIAGGWEIIAIMGLTIALCIALFVLLLVVDIRKTYD